MYLHSLLINFYNFIQRYKCIVLSDNLRELVLFVVKHSQKLQTSFIMYSRNKRSQPSSKKLLQNLTFSMEMLNFLQILSVIVWPPCGYSSQLSDVASGKPVNCTRCHLLMFLSTFIFIGDKFIIKIWLNLNEVKLEALIDNMQQIIFFLDYHYMKG